MISSGSPAKLSRPSAEEVVSSMTVGAVMIGLNGHIILANEALAKIYGYRSPGDLSGRPVAGTLMSRDDFRRVVDGIKTSGVNIFEFKSKRRDGSDFLCQIKMSFISGSKEGMRGYIAVVEDITHFREVYRDLDRLAARYEAILSLVPDIIMEMDADGTYRWANDAGFAFFGDKVVGSKAEAFFAPPPSLPFMSSILADGGLAVYRESWQLTQYGDKRLLAWWYRVLRDTSGEVTGIICTARDITEFKMAEMQLRESEAALRNSEARMRVLAKELKEWIWEFDTNGLYTYSGTAVEDILGYTSDEIVGKKHFYDFIHPDDVKQLKKRIMKNIDDGKRINEFLSRNVHKNGESKWLSTSGIPATDQDGKLIGYWGLSLDITERVKAEEIRDTLIRNFTHSMKTPLAMINMAQEMCKIAMEKGDWNMMREAHDVANLNLRTLNNDLDNILQSMAIEGTKPNFTRVSLRSAIADVLAKFGDFIKAKKLKVEVDVPDDANGVKADERELGLLIRNVVDNAIKYTDAGEISIQARLKGNFVVMKVKDTGCGVAAKDIGKLQDKFFRVNAAVPGIGLGLSICSDVAKRMDGRIDIFSEGRGKGTTIVVEMPKA
jgi:PAS domain S-box-containing protein